MDDASSAGTRVWTMYARPVAFRGRELMGEVLVLFRLLPDGVDVDMDTMREEVKRRIPEGVRLRGIETKDIAFGLRALNVVVQMKDAEGGPDAIQRALETIPRVQSVEILDMGLL